ETLSISLVDGISCGLAAALLLFIIFAINISISRSSLDGSSGHGTATKILSDLKTEPVDIVVEVRGPTSSFVGGAGWAPHASAADHVVVNEMQGTMVFIRQLKKGFSEARGLQAPQTRGAAPS